MFRWTQRSVRTLDLFPGLSKTRATPPHPQASGLFPCLKIKERGGEGEREAEKERKEGRKKTS